MIVDDQDDIRLLLRLLIQRANEGLVVVAEAASGWEAIDRIGDSDPLVVILDQMMPELNGIDTATELRARRPAQIIILCSAYLDADLMARARAAGVHDFLPKEQLQRLPDVIRQAVGV
jgi:CheY-like chemotaxis protein